MQLKGLQLWNTIYPAPFPQRFMRRPGGVRSRLLHSLALDSSVAGRPRKNGHPCQRGLRAKVKRARGGARHREFTKSFSCAMKTQGTSPARRDLFSTGRESFFQGADSAPSFLKSLALGERSEAPLTQLENLINENQRSPGCRIRLGNRAPHRR